MLRVPITYAKPGMELAVAIRHPLRPGHVLLNAGYKLDESAISRLSELKMRELWIRYPNLDFIGKHINPAILDGQAVIAQTLGESFDRVMSNAHAQIDYAAFRSAIRDLIDKLVSDPSAAIFVQEIAGGENDLLRHSCSTMILSLLMGLKLDGYLVAQRKRLTPSRAKNVENLGVGALFHDIGMLRLDAETHDHWRATRDMQDPRWRKHVELGYELLKGHVEPTAAAAVLHHHQSYDGTGFPSRKDPAGDNYAPKEQRIHIFPRIIAVADAFDRVRNPIGTTKPLANVIALRKMQERDIAQTIDPVIYCALLAVAPAYTPGAIVRLSDGRAGVVTSWTHSNPCRPTIQVISGIEDGRIDNTDTTSERIDLRAFEHLHIIESEGQDVAEANFYPQTDNEYLIDTFGWTAAA